MNKFVLVVFFTSWQFVATAHILTSKDSIGITTRNNEKFIVHAVEAGETLYSLAHKYHVSTDDLARINPILKSDGLKAGSRIFVPLKKPQNSSTPQPATGTIYHAVKPKETLYSISRQYGVSLKDIRRWNHLPDNNISIGQELAIKKMGATAMSEAGSNKMAESPGQKKIHIVKASETLYGISRLYDVPTNELREWNNLPDNGISIGQKLYVSPPQSEQTTAPAEKPKASEKNSSMLPGSVDSANKNPISNAPAAPVKKEVENSRPNLQDVDMGEVREIKKVLEHGIAEVIDDSNDTKKYLALHRSAPVGTIMQIKNEMNNQSVFVRVVGSIPNTGDNDKVLVKISKKAYERLGAVDPRFPVEVSYIP